MNSGSDSPSDFLNLDNNNNNYSNNNINIDFPSLRPSPDEHISNI